MRSGSTTTRRRAAVCLATLLVVGGLWAATTAPAQTAEPEIGWWTSDRLGDVLLGRALLVPDGGSQVATSVEGPVSVATVRFPVGPGGADYRVATQPGSDVTATIIACPVLGPWTPTAGGDLADAPAWSCSTAQAEGVYDVEAGVFAWTLGPAFVRDGVLSAAFLPPEGATPYTVTMQAPGDDAVTPRPDPTPATAPPSDNAPSTTVASSSGSGTSGSGSTGSGGGSTAGSGGFSPPATAAPSVATPIAGSASAPSEPATGSVSALPTTTVAGAAVDTTGVEEAASTTSAPSSTAGRLLGLFVLVALAAAVAYLTAFRNRNPAAVAATGAADAAGTGPAVRGVGRFSKSRDQPPISI